MATHRILHKVEPGKLKMELTDKKGTNTGEISFILQASGGRFAQSSGTGTGTGSTSQRGTGTGTGTGTGAGAGLGAGAGAGALAAGILVLSLCFLAPLLQTLDLSTPAFLILCHLEVALMKAVLAGASSGRGTRTGTGSEESRNQTYESSTASGARSGATGAGMGSGSGYGQTGGVTEGVRGLNITERSGVSMADLFKPCNFALVLVRLYFQV